MNTRSRGTMATRLLAFAGALAFLIASPASWATAMFSASIGVDYMVSSNPSGIDVGVNDLNPPFFDSFTTTGGNAFAEGTGSLSPSSVTIGASGWASGMPADPNSLATASVIGFLGLEIENATGSTGSVSITIDWEWMASVGAALAGELAEIVNVKLDTILSDASFNPIDETTLFDLAFSTSGGSPGGMDSGSTIVEIRDLPDGAFLYLDLLPEIVNGSAESNYQGAPEPSAILLLGLGLGALGFTRKRA